MKIRPPAPRPSMPPVKRAATPLAKKAVTSKGADSFAGGVGSLKSRLAQARKLVKPAFKDIFEGLRKRDPSIVLAGTTALATQLGVPYAPPKNAGPRQLVTILGRLIVSPGFTLDSRRSMHQLASTSVGMVAQRTGRPGINDPDPSLRL